jgi:uncharacterized protein YndB with AHSA1/START domain
MNDTSAAANAATETLVIKRTVPAAVERVWDAWTNPDKLSKWFAPEGFDVGEIRADAKAGGEYRIEMLQPNAEDHTVTGQYLEVVRYERIQSTWRWKGSDIETLLTIEFAAGEGGTTELTLTHERFPDAELRDKHHEGWTSVLNRLDVFVS